MTIRPASPAKQAAFAPTLLIILITVVGVWLRFQRVGAIEFNIDQVYPLWQAIQTLDTGALPLIGQGTSVLFANPPLTGYLFVPVLALVRHPAAAFVFTLALNTLALPLAYRALRRMIGTRPALVSAALFAASPWIIEDSRRTWVQSLAPFFVCLIFWALAPLLTGRTNRPARRLLIALIGLALFAHTYLLAYAMIAPVAVLLLLHWRRVPLVPLLAGVAVFAALAIPYAAGLARDWDTTRARIDAFAAGDASLSDEALGHALRLVTGAGYAMQRGTRAPAEDADLRADLSAAASVVWNVAILAGALRALWMLAGRNDATPHQRDVARILLIWFGLPVLLMSYVSRSVHPFYLLLTLPAGHALAGWGVAPLLKHRTTAVPLAAVVAATVALNAINTVRFAQQSAALPGEDAPYIFPLAESSLLGERLQDARRSGMVVISPMDEWTPVVVAGENFRTERIENFAQAALVPARGALYFNAAGPDDPTPVPPPYGRAAGTPLTLADGTVIAFWTLAPEHLEITRPADVPSDIGVQFAGWTLRRTPTPGATITLDTFWRIDALRDDRGVWAFAPFAHLLDGSGARLAIADGAVIPPLTWEAGDVIVQRHTFEVPADAREPFAFDVGLYDAVRRREDGTPGINAIFHLPDGNETLFTPTIRLEP